MSVHVHSPRPVDAARCVRWCPCCKARRRFIVKMYEWYGAYSTCCACGSQWSDGEPQRSSKADRRKASERARGEWRNFGKPQVQP